MSGSIKSSVHDPEEDRMEVHNRRRPGVHRSGGGNSSVGTVGSGGIPPTGGRQSQGGFLGLSGGQAARVQAYSQGKGNEPLRPDNTGKLNNSGMTTPEDWTYTKKSLAGSRNPKARRP